MRGTCNSTQLCIGVGGSNGLSQAEAERSSPRCGVLGGLGKFDRRSRDCRERERDQPNSNPTLVRRPRWLDNPPSTPVALPSRAVHTRKRIPPPIYQSIRATSHILARREVRSGLTSDRTTTLFANKGIRSTTHSAIRKAKFRPA